MKRSEFLVSLAGSALAAPAMAVADEGPFPGTSIEVERAQPGKPHAGKVLAAIQPHADDLPIFAGGLVLKLMNEGYTGYLIRTTNDDHTGPGSVGEGVLANERDNLAVARSLKSIAICVLLPRTAARLDRSSAVFWQYVTVS